MIPIVTRCTEEGTAPCPRLFEQLDSIRTTALTAVVTAVGAGECGDSLVSMVCLPPYVLAHGNTVLVYPESVEMVKVQGKSALVQTRSRVTASLVVALSGYPTAFIEEGEGYFNTPNPEETHAAAKFIMSLGWCVWCALVDAIGVGNLIPGLDQFDNVTLADMNILDLDAGMAGLEIKISWLQ